MMRTWNIIAAAALALFLSFNPSEDSVLKSPRGKMQLVFQTEDNTLFASDSGGGFQRGAPEPASPVPASSPGATPLPGRLPNSPPPIPQS